jgi:hypothetical protein
VGQRAVEESGQEQLDHLEMKNLEGTEEMKWLLIIVSLLEHGPIHSEVGFDARPYPSLSACKAMVDKIEQGKTPTEIPGTAYCYGVDLEQTQGRLVGSAAQPGRTGWLPYSVIGEYQVK